LGGSQTLLIVAQALSANICSLLGDVDRYALSVFWELDGEMNVVNAWFGRTVIRSEYKVACP
jgi:DIS3-like exonuclease 1